MSNAQLLTIAEIAAWALPYNKNTPKPEPLALLPKLQRSPAWKAEQIERLWDSLVRGFPVGSLLVSQYGKRKDLEAKSFLLQETQERNALWHPDSQDWHLLDGQQRANAIALGFFNPWTNPDHREGGKLSYTLWVDLYPVDWVDDRVFVFRLLTRSHPWGYQRLNPKLCLIAASRRDAAATFEQANNGSVLKAGQLPLQAVPFDAKAPIPVAVFLECLKDDNVWQSLGRRLSEFYPQPDTAEKLPASLSEQRERIDSLLSADPISDHLNLLAEGFQRLVTSDSRVFRIPALIVPPHHRPPPRTSDLERQQEDPIATLFIRVNSAGIVPRSEELAYSLLKSEWNGCHQLVEELPYSFLSPALMVAQISSLILAKAAIRNDTQEPPGFPDLRTFRRLVHGGVRGHEDFLCKIRQYLEEGRAKAVIKAAERIMICKQSCDRQFRLLPAQGAKLARRSRRIFFLFLSWVDSRPDLQDPWLGLDEDAHRRLLGVITALSWFGWDEEGCVSELWRYRAALHEPGTLLHVARIRNGRIRLLPLVPPDILRSAVSMRVENLLKDDTFWDTWHFWTHFANDPIDIDGAPEWYSRFVDVPPELHEGDAGIRFRGQAWANFVVKLREARELTLYAQSATLLGWFPDFDPASTDPLEDTDQPWDFDHILPNAYKSAHHVPKVIREWQSSTGNLRAWPAELNRSDGATKPFEKLCDPMLGKDSREMTVYGLDSQTSRLTASAITAQELDLWCKACPNGMLSNYLAQIENNNKRHIVLDVITKRWIRLYEHWFQNLHINELIQVNAQKHQ